MRIFILRNEDPILDYVNSSLINQGHTTWILEGASADFESLTSAIQNFRPDFCLTNGFENFALRPFGKELEEFFAHHQIPLVVWYFEAPNFAGGNSLLERWETGPFPKGFLFLVSDTHYLDFFKKRNLEARYLPLAAPASLAEWRPKSDLSSSFQGKFFYSGSTFLKYIDYQLAEVSPAVIADVYLRRLLSEICGMLGTEINSESFTDLKRLFLEIPFSEGDYRSREARLEAGLMGYGFLDRTRILNRTRMYYGYYHLTIALQLLRNLVPFQISGDPCWQFFFRDIPKRYSLDELYNAFYGSTAVFCLTKHLFVNFVHERIPTVLLAGGLPITDYRKDLDRLYAKDEYVAYQSFEEAIELFHFYRDHPNARFKLIQRGRSRVLGEHTYAHRAKSIVTFAADFYGLNERSAQAASFLQSI